MEVRERWIVVSLSIVGMGVSLLSLFIIVFEIVNNTLPWRPQQTIREFYVAVGQSFSQGFMSGFFLCFFLAMVAVVLTNRGKARS